MINWIKTHKLILFLTIIILFLGSRSFFGVNLLSSQSIPSLTKSVGVKTVPMAGNVDYFYQESTPVQADNRLVIQDSSLSLVVKDVSKSILDIESKTKEFGGYLVDSSLSKPESAASGSITIRVPEEKRQEALSVYKNLAVKVVSESVHGSDVTDEYVDLESRLAILNQTKNKYQEIMDRAVSVTDLMNVQRELINLQSQIDNLKGQQKYYEQSAKLSKIMIYLSTDELALPYAPTTEWRPAVVFKTAIRSLVGNIRNIGSVLIWVAVYSPLIFIIYLIIRYTKNRLSKN